MQSLLSTRSTLFFFKYIFMMEEQRNRERLKELCCCEIMTQNCSLAKRIVLQISANTPFVPPLKLHLAGLPSFRGLKAIKL